MSTFEVFVRNHLKIHSFDYQLIIAYRCYCNILDVWLHCQDTSETCELSSSRPCDYTSKSCDEDLQSERAMLPASHLLEIRFEDTLQVSYKQWNSTGCQRSTTSTWTLTGSISGISGSHHGLSLTTNSARSMWMVCVDSTVTCLTFPHAHSTDEQDV